ncbi:MAG: DUF47 family protein [Candidatus Thermoplasmatota archaeon]|nr:DUF47 family protein [Candidatus Thermoplasmatota archaeon]MCL5731180.1 DUF47 family protein [Candidatus Thermoplasmatota archaeon]
MVGRNFFKKFLVVGEKQILQELETFFNIGIKADIEITQMLSNFGSGTDRNYEKVREMEKGADEISNNLHMEITHGAISSTLMGTLSELVEKCDTIIDASYFIVREIRRYNHAASASRNLLPEWVRDSYSVFARMIEKHTESLNILLEMLKSGNLDQMRETRKLIEMKEEEVDEMKDDLIDSLYRENENITYLTFIHLMEMVHKIDDLLDYCEDISDLLLNIANSISA